MPPLPPGVDAMARTNLIERDERKRVVNDVGGEISVILALVNIVVGFVYGLLVFVGTFLIIVPGLLAYIAVENRNFVDVLWASYRLSKGHWVPLFVLVFILVAASALFGAVVDFLGSLLLPAAFSQLALTVLQSPVMLFTLAAIAAAFRQLRDRVGCDFVPVFDPTGKVEIR